ncbi:MAG: TetR/AcrR family transcriptional regulator, partial [Hyphomicrobiaceae bacterium]
MKFRKLLEIRADIHCIVGHRIMARPREFDEDVVLDQAIACFCRRGLEGTSIRELTERMGINTPSLYNAFGDKFQLFKIALERYADQIPRNRIAALSTEVSPLVAIEKFLEGAVERAKDDPERRGCMIINSALEVAPHNAEIGAMIAEYLG